MNLAGQLRPLEQEQLIANLGFPDCLERQLRPLDLNFLGCPGFLERQLRPLEQEQLTATLAFLDYPVRRLHQSGLKNLAFPAFLDYPVGLLPLLGLVRYFENPVFPDCLVRP